MKNFEKYVPAKDREAAFYQFCARQESCKSCVLSSFSESTPTACAFAWLDIDFEEEKPMPCPFCGAATEIEIDENGGYSIACIHCEYGSPVYNESEYAIEHHNRICRAVAAAKESEVK